MNLSSHSSPLNGQSPETEKNSNDLKRKILQEIQIGSDPKRWRISESPQKKHRNAEPDIALDQKYEEKTLELSEDFIQLQTFHYRPNKMENNYEKWSKVVRKSYLKARSKFERQATKKFKVNINLFSFLDCYANFFRNSSIALLILRSPSLVVPLIMMKLKILTLMKKLRTNLMSLKMLSTRLQRILTRRMNLMLIVTPMKMIPSSMPICPMKKHFLPWFIGLNVKWTFS